MNREFIVDFKRKKRIFFVHLVGVKLKDSVYCIDQTLVLLLLAQMDSTFTICSMAYEQKVGI